MILSGFTLHGPTISRVQSKFLLEDKLKMHKTIFPYSKLKILFPYVGGDDLGGSHISSMKLIDLLNQTDQFEAIIGLHRAEGRLGDYLRSKNVAFQQFTFPDLIEPKAKRTKSASATFFHYMTRTVPKMRSYLQQESIDIVHTNDGRMHLNWALPTKLSTSKLVWHHRGDPTARATNYLAPLLADQLITVSKFSKPNRPIRSIDKKWSVVHSPFDTLQDIDRAEAKARILNELGLPPETHILGYFGELIKRKRPVEFAEIIAEFSQAHPNMKIVGIVLGTVPTGAQKLDEKMMARAGELGVAHLVKQLGFRTPIEPIMAATDILLVPALNEPFGRTLIEAMHLGTAVVATDHGGNPEAIVNGETGFLVPPMQPKTFVEPINKLLTDTDLFKTITSNAQIHVRQHLTLKSHLDGIMAAYQKLFKPGIDL